MFNTLDMRGIAAAIQKACDAAAEKGVAVTVRLVGRGFFDNEKFSLTVTAAPPPAKS